jgi:hypothetical protein
MLSCHQRTNIETHCGKMLPYHQITRGARVGAHLTIVKWGVLALRKHRVIPFSVNKVGGSEIRASDVK